jgi:hypothetical protein
VDRELRRKYRKKVRRLLERRAMHRQAMLQAAPKPKEAAVPHGTEPRMELIKPEKKGRKTVKKAEESAKKSGGPIDGHA